MSKKILISVFCYNVGQFIFGVLENIYSSSHHDTSIIIINDYSKDNTISEIYKFIENDARISDFRRNELLSIFQELSKTT